MNRADTSHPAAASGTPPFLFIGFTVAAAFTAAAAAWTSVAFGLPVWAMFIGWVAYFTRGHSLRDGVANLACVVAGVALAILAALSLGVLQPTLGSLALPLVVFVVAMLVVALRAVPVMSNLLAYFLGLVAFFAAHLPPTLGTLLHLAAAAALGAAAAWVSTRLQAGLLRSHR